MSRINWNSINWHDFETLVSILVSHKDIEAKTYLRLGRDAGIDIESGDKKIKYQIKYINNQENFSGIISKARQELQKIKEYKNPTHKNLQYWSKAKEWHLITNASYNKQDEEKWKNQIVKPFLQETGLKVKLKHNTWLRRELKKFPDLIAEYFGGDNRVLLSLPEAINSKENDIIFSKGFNPNFIEGRDEELKKFSNFIEEKDKKIILIHGQGGVGKTRFAIETGIQTNKKGYDIFWANTATMEKSTNWFQSIVSGRKTLLIIDEPTDQKLIEVLLEQISSHRIANWKFAIITRSAKDHILKPLNPNKINAISDNIELFPLNKEPIEKIISALIEESDKLKSSININELKSGISTLSGGIPIWVIISFKIFEEKGSIIDLPKDTYDLANNYIEECLSSLSKKHGKSKLYKVLKTIAILQPIYIESVSQSYDYFQSLVEGITKSELEEIFKTLQEKNLASKRGRLLEIKPDVIRDYIILKRIGENREESKEWLEKILHMQGSEKKESALKQLARIEYYNKFQEQTKTFLDPTWDIFIKKAKEDKLKELKDTFALAESISFSNLPKFIEFIQNIQNNPYEKESVRYAWGEKGYLYLKDLILQSSWALYKAGVYAQSEEEAKLVFKELLNLAEKEQPFIKSLSPFPYSDSSRAVRVIERLMTKSLYYDNMDVVSNWIIERLDEINNLNEDQAAVLKVLITECFFKLETNIFNFTDNIFESKQVIFGSNSKLNKCRNQIFKKIWSTLNSDQIQVEKRKDLWVTLKDYQKQINYRIRKTAEKDTTIHQEQELEDNLSRIKKYLSEKEVSKSELSALRDIWKWQLKYDKRAFLKGLAQDCEKLLLEKNKVDSDFISLYDNAPYDLKSKKIQDYSKKLDSKNKIHSFVEDNFNYSKNNPYILMNIARNLGGCEKLSNHVSNYIEEIIKSNKTDYHFEFVCEIILAHFDAKRNSKESAFDLLMYYWRHCKSIERKETFLNIMYHPKPKPNLEKEDIKFIFEILSQNDTILSKKLLYIISYFSGSILLLDFNQSKSMIEYIFQKSELNKRATLFKNFVEAINDRYSINKYSQNLEEQSFNSTKDIFIWLIGLLQNIPSIDWLDIHGGEGLKELKEDLNVKFSVLDFVKILKERITIIKEKNDSLWKNIFVDQDFIKIIDPISEKDISSQQIKKSLNTLLDSNNHPLLYYKLPSICIKIDPCGFLIPTLITEQITSKKFLWEKLKDIPPEGEWTRYAGYYPINSKQWREIAKTACKVAIDKTETEKKSIFSSLLEQKPQVISGSLNEVAPYYYIKLDQAKSDFSNETDQNIKEFMKWRLKVAEKELEEEKQIIEENHD